MMCIGGRGGAQSVGRAPASSGQHVGQGGVAGSSSTWHGDDKVAWSSASALSRGSVGLRWMAAGLTVPAATQRKGEGEEQPNQ
jgi:hypothetical protein